MGAFQVQARDERKLECNVGVMCKSRIGSLLNPVDSDERKLECNVGVMRM